MINIKKIIRKIAKFIDVIYQVFKSFIKLMYKNKKSAIGFSVILFFVFAALIGPFLFQYDGLTSGAMRFDAPSFEHLLGTDYLGRDVLQMIIDGAKGILMIAFFTGLFTVTLGVIIGISSALIGGIFDRFIQLITNLLLTIPSFPILMILATIITIKDPLTFAGVLSVWSWPGLSRAVRAQVLSIKESDFIQICQVMNMSKFHIIIKEILPNMAAYILINFIIIMRAAIIGSVGIMMLGVAALEPSNWGAMIYDVMNQGAFYVPSAYASVLAPIFTIILFQYGIIMLANGLDETFNPRLQTQ